MKKIEEALELLQSESCSECRYIDVSGLCRNNKKPCYKMKIISDAQQELATLKQNLKGIEWSVDKDYESYKLCPVCYAIDKNGHHTGCWLTAAISEGGGGEG